MNKPLPEKLGQERRSLSIRTESAAINTDKRTLNLSFSSEAPVDRWFGTEILSHDANAARLERLNDAAPLLYNHNFDDLLGVIERAWIGADRRAYADVRFGQDERGDWAMKQVTDGILRNASFAYRVYKFITDEKTDTYTAIDWEPLEISLVTVPADQSIGVGRSTNTDERPVVIEYRNRGEPPGNNPNPPAAGELQQPAAAGFLMSRGNVTMTDTVTPAAGAAQTQAINQDEILANERARIAEITAMCQAHNIMAEKRAKMIQDGISIETARGLVLEELLARGQRQTPLGNEFNPDLSASEKKNYSLLRAINASITGNWKGAGFELECSNAIGKKIGRGAKVDEATGVGGFFMPTNVEFARHLTKAERAAYAVGTPGSGVTGGTLVAATLLPGEFIELLRNQARVIEAGARMLSGLVGNVTIPRQTGASTAYWTTEGGAFTESEGSFDSVTLAIKTLGTRSLITRNMLVQSTPDIEMLVRADLIKVLALGIDAAALYGLGSPAPTGIAALSGVNPIVGGTNGAAITIDHLIAMEAAVLDANADFETLAYLANAKTIGALKSLKSTTGAYLWTNSANGGRSSTPGDINGYPVYRSNQVRKNLTKGTQDGSTAAKFVSEVFYGAWEEILIGEWGVLELLPNPYDPVAYANGGILLRALQSLDIAIRHPQSFAYMADAIVLP